jgi:hypothetical protein
VAERPGQRDGRAVDGADGGGPGAAEEGPGGAVAADLVEPVGAEQDEREGRAEGDDRGKDATDQAGRGVADDGYGLDDGAGGDLAEGHGVEELGAGHPVVMAIERSRQVILRAALGELGQAGYAAFTIESVAAQYGAGTLV